MSSKEQQRLNEELYTACANGDVSEVKKLLSRGGDVNYHTTRQNGYNDTPLHTSARKGHEDVVKLLLKQPAVNVDARNKAGYTPLHDCARSGHPAVAKLLLDAGASLSSVNNIGQTPLHYCASNGHPAVAKLLLDAGASLSSVDNSGNSPLHYAADSGHVDTVEFLLQQGANVSLCDKYGNSPLHHAAYRGHLDIVKFLSHGANMSLQNKDGQTALDKARDGKNNRFVNKEAVERVVHYLESVESQSASTTATPTTSTSPQQPTDLVDADATQEAFQQEVGVCVSNLVVNGSPGSGKTCVVNLSVGEPAPDVRNSTGCVETPVRAIAQGTIYANGTNLQKLQTEEMLLMVCQAMRHKVDEIESEQVFQKKRHHKVSSNTVPTTEQSSSTPSVSDDIPKSTKASSTASEDKEENLQVFAKLVVKISSAEASTEFLTAHLVLTIDSGGQPHFMDVAPLFLRNSSLFLITMKLNERLDSKPKFNYFINGQPIEMSDTELQPTNLQIIELLAKSISSLQLSTSTSTPSSDGSESRHAKFMIVGTFADKAEECQDESVADKNSILRDRLKDYEAERIDAGNDVIFAVNAITTDPDERREAALRLQDKITNTPGTTIKTRIKLRWFGLLLHLLDEAEKKGVSIIPLEDVLAAGRCLQMNSSEILQAIAFFHELNLLMYFSTDKLGSIVFIDVKPILGKVSNLIGISFIDRDKLDKIFSPTLPADAQRLLRDYGRFSREILDSSFHFSAPLTTDVFLDLLEHLCVIARIEKGGQTSFFLPCALPHAPDNVLQENENISSMWIVTLQTRRGTILVDVPIPKSYLPTLTVLLLNSSDFEADLTSRQYRNLMSVHYRGSSVYLLERNLQLEIYYPCADDDEEMRQDCSFIRSAIKNALVVVEERLHFVPNILIKNDAFLCSCDSSRHICVYNKDRNRTSCNRSKNKLRKINQQQQYWLQQQPAAPVTMQPTTELPPPVVPTSGTAAPILPSGTAAPILPSADPLNKPPTIKELLRRVASRATDKWELVGLDLEIEQHQLNTILQSHPRNAIRCYSEVFSIWQRKADPPFTWATIIDTLRSPIVEENALAQEIEDWLRTAAT